MDLKLVGETSRTFNGSYDDILSHITYKDNIKFYWQADARQNRRLVIEFKTIDSYNPPEPMTVVHYFLCPWDSELVWTWSDKEKIEWIFECVLKTERHEAREFFKVDGKVFDPPGHGFEDPYR